MSNYILCKTKKSKGTYLGLAVSNGFGKGISQMVGIGYWEDIKEKYSLSSLDDIKPLAKLIEVSTDKKGVKSKFFELLEPMSVRTNVKNIGIDLIYKVIKELELFSFLPNSKHKSLQEVLEFIIGTRIIFPRSYICQYKNKNDFMQGLNIKKSSIYNYLDIFLENKNTILLNLYDKLKKLTDRNEKVIHFDNTTVYFESFSRNGIRNKGFSKDGKHNEDQIVIAMATDNNGIPFHYKVFPGNTADSQTLITFLVEMKKIYNIKDVVVIADRGLSQSANIRFLEQKGYKFIFQKRIDNLNAESRNFIVQDKDYMCINNIFSKERIIESSWNKKRFNGNYRKQIVYFSPSKETLDKVKRKNLIDRINKKSINGTICLSDLVPEYKKKYMDVDGVTVGKLNYDKIKKIADQDGFYMIETNILDLSAEKANEIYRQQWKIEEGFRILKSSLEIRPIFVHKEEHILAHVFLCFLSLVVLKYSIFKLKKFYEINGEIQKITIHKFIDALKLVTVTQKIVNDEVVSEITNNLDPSHKELNKIYSDFYNILEK